jgi:hypothetical protein
MAKHPQPYFRAQRGTWCVHLDGKQIALGADEKEAFTLYHKLMTERASPSYAVLTKFRRFSGVLSPQVVNWQRDVCQSVL